MKKDIQFWNKVAPKYAQEPISDMESYRFTLERTRSYLKTTDRVLEIGAGTGSTALELAENVREIVATDFADDMLRIGRRRAAEQMVGNVAFDCRDANDLPEGPFDAVLAHNVLHLIEDLPAVLRDVHGVLKPGGLMISKTFVKPTFFCPKIMAMRVALPVMQLLGKAPFVAMMSLQDFEQAFRDAGFEIEESAFYPKKHPRRYLVARKL